ncbi:hypothetical protein ABIE67_006968 [Streptomyces sp. V4I8]
MSPTTRSSLARAVPTALLLAVTACTDAAPPSPSSPSSSSASASASVRVTANADGHRTSRTVR